MHEELEGQVAAQLKENSCFQDTQLARQRLSLVQVQARAHASARPRQRVACPCAPPTAPRAPVAAPAPPRAPHLALALARGGQVARGGDVDGVGGMDDTLLLAVVHYLRERVAARPHRVLVCASLARSNAIGQPPPGHSIAAARAHKSGPWGYGLRKRMLESPSKPLAAGRRGLVHRVRHCGHGAGAARGRSLGRGQKKKHTSRPPPQKSSS